MRKFFYAELALNNIRKNAKTYFPYILTSIGTIMMFYIMSFISKNQGLSMMSGGEQLRIMLNLGVYVIGIFSIIFLFYTNSFLVKRRKKEFGLYNILGMEKKHIAKVMLWETLFVSISSIIVGILSGILGSKLMFLLLLKILKFEVPFGFIISKSSIISSIILFSMIFSLTLLNNLRQIQLSKPVELLKGGQTGEKEPKTKWILTLLGIISLGAGYYIALTTESPLAALNLFFIAVVLVIIGTYALFTSGTIAVLKLLRKNKQFYYKPSHFINVSGMIYRMKQNAVGLANIAILSSFVLVMLSTTVSLYIGMEDVLRTRYPRDISVGAENISVNDSKRLESIIKEEASSYQISMENIVHYRYLSIITLQKDNQFTTERFDMSSADQISVINLMPLSEYNKLVNKNETIKENEVLLYSYRGKIPGETLFISDSRLSIKARIDQLPIDGSASAMLSNTYFVIMKDESAILDFVKNLPKENTNNASNLSFHYAFDASGKVENEISLTQSIKQRIKEESFVGNSEGVEESKESFFSLYGGLFFLGIFLGGLFIMATVLIIYYKQISEGFEDKDRFEIMQKVGLSKSEVKKTIRSQVLMVFFLPLVTAVVHIAFSFKVITKLLNLLNLTNIPLFALCTVGTILIFAAFYTLVYSLTARVYYKIVS